MSKCQWNISAKCKWFILGLGLISLVIFEAVFDYRWVAIIYSFYVKFYSICHVQGVHTSKRGHCSWDRTVSCQEHTMIYTKLHETNAATIMTITTTTIIRMPRACQLKCNFHWKGHWYYTSCFRERVQKFLSDTRGRGSSRYDYVLKFEPCKKIPAPPSGVTWPEEAFIHDPEITNLYDVANPVTSRAWFNGSKGLKVKLGDTVKVFIQLYDGRGQKKTRGGDLVSNLYWHKGPSKLTK